MTHKRWLATLFSAVGLLWLSSPASAQFKNALKALTTRFDVRADLKEIPFKEALGVFSKLTGVAISIDPQSLKPGQNLADVENHLVRVPKLNAVLLAGVLRHMSKQVGGSFVIRGDQLVVVLNNPDANMATSEKTPLQRQLEAAVQKQLAVKITVAKKDGVPLDEALYALAYKHKLNLLIDAAEFAKAGKNQVEATPIDVPAQKNVTLAAALQKTLEPVRGVYQVRDNVIWIEPAGKK